MVQIQPYNFPCLCLLLPLMCQEKRFGAALCYTKFYWESDCIQDCQVLLLPSDTQHWSEDFTHSTVLYVSSENTHYCSFQTCPKQFVGFRSEVVRTASEFSTQHYIPLLFFQNILSHLREPVKWIVIERWNWICKSGTVMESQRYHSIL